MGRDEPSEQLLTLLPDLYFDTFSGENIFQENRNRLWNGGTSVF